MLSILLRTGTNHCSVKELSIALLKEIDFYDLENLHYQTLRRVKGVGEVKAITLLCAIEFGKRVSHKKSLTTQIKTGQDAYFLVKEELENELQEKFVAIYLDTKNYVIMKKVLFMGTVNQSSVTARDAFREAVKNNAAKMIMVHNHPAGSIQPSYEDVYITNTFIKLGNMMGITIVDHLIIGRDTFYSFRQNQSDLFKE